jgi:hypothetical protein
MSMRIGGSLTSAVVAATASPPANGANTSPSRPATHSTSMYAGG